MIHSQAIFPPSWIPSVALRSGFSVRHGVQRSIEVWGAGIHWGLGCRGPLEFGVQEEEDTETLSLVGAGVENQPHFQHFWKAQIPGNSFLGLFPSHPCKGGRTMKG